MTQVDFDPFTYAIKTKGYYVQKSCVKELELLDRLSDDIDRSIDFDSKKIESYDQYRFYDIVHFLFGRGNSFIELLDNDVVNANVEKILGATPIVHSYNAVRLMPNSKNNATKVHRDSPRFYDSSYPLALQALVCVDHFSTENGGTFLLPASHHINQRPTDDFFYENAIQIQAERGDVVFFDSLIWHAGGENRTTMPRRGITIVYTRPFMKQQIDIVRALTKVEIGTYSSRVQRLIGMNVRVPGSLDEFYLPEAERLYKSNQG